MMFFQAGRRSASLPKTRPMNLERIKERVDAVPFRPFIIETTGGTQIEVISPDYVMFAISDFFYLCVLRGLAV
jgi:hypothetical protein